MEYMARSSDILLRQLQRILRSYKYVKCRRCSIHQTCKKLVQESTLEGNLIFIKTHFSFIPNKITFLEKQDVLLADFVS